MIEKEKVINDLQYAVNDNWMWRHADYYALTMERAIALLKEQPEIVRCKDCKWFYQPFKSEGRCLNHDNDYHEPNWFCADGERKEYMSND